MTLSPSMRTSGLEDAWTGNFDHAANAGGIGLVGARSAKDAALTPEKNAIRARQHTTVANPNVVILRPTDASCLGMT